MAGDTKLGSASIPIRATLDELDKDLEGVRGHVERALSGVQDLGKVALGGLALGALGVASAIATIGPAAIKSASDLNESVSKANVVFGDSVKVIDAFAASSAEAFGIAKGAAYESTSTFGNLFTTMGLGKDSAAGMSVDIVKLAADLASFNNLDTADVLQKLRSGLIGEAEPMRSLGVMLTADAVEAKALAMGLTKVAVDSGAVTKATGELAASQQRARDILAMYGNNSKQYQAALKTTEKSQKALTAAQAGGVGPLTESAKLQARYALILEQTKTAQGDFSRTSDGLANTQRILDATFKDISADIGTAFLPMVLGVAQAVTPIVKALMPRLQSILAKIAPLAKMVGESFGEFVGSLIAGMPPVAAFQNLLSSLFPPGIDLLFGDLTNEIYGFLASIQPTIDQVKAWLSDNVKLQDVLIAIGIAIAAVVIPAILGIVAAVAPIVLAFVALVAIVALVRKAWEENWGGIRDALTAAWTGTILPALQQLWAWLQVAVPAAIQTLADFWTGTLQPALSAVWNFITTSVLPMLGQLWTWLATNVPAALQTLAGFWTGTLQPALATVWSFLQANVIPMLGQLATWLQVNVPKAVTDLQNAFSANWPVIQAAVLTAWNVIQAVAGAIIDVFTKNVAPSLRSAIDAIVGAFKSLGISWDDVGRVLGLVGAVVGAVVLGIIGVVVGMANGIASAIKEVTGHFDAVVKSGMAMYHGLIQAFAGLVEFAKAILSGDWNTAMQAWKVGMEGLLEFWRNLWTAFSNAVQMEFGFITGFVSGFVGGIVAFFTDLYNRLVGQSIVTDMIAGIVAAFTSLGSLILAPLGSFISTVGAVFQAAADLIIGTLVSALQTLWSVVQTYIIPVVQGLANVVSVILIGALTILTAFWNEVLSPVFAAIWGFISESLLPIFQTVADLVTTVVVNAFEGLWLLFTQQFLPVLQTIWGFIQTNLIPIFNAVVDSIRKNLGPAFEWARVNILNPFIEALQFIMGFIDEIRKKISGLTNALAGVHLPGAGGGGAPEARAGGGPVSAMRPYVVGERGPEWFVPDVSGAIVPTEAGRVTNSSPSYTLNVYTSAPAEDIVADFAMLQTMAA